ncbi:BTB/POZ domain-containing protein At4g08455-like [Rhodamnia argentea]|uniref:BTB/POZ domain-containing protein At4g08455-like n=1 Tax=Rhodamnia argentea TaxID=178133 RepID=A0A8B8QDA8_9MYRT|nr:BTB/POZ domain-containing protein At4g08455-like [Rhodamnia argentea]
MISVRGKEAKRFGELSLAQQMQRLCARQDHLLEEGESETDSVTETMRCISCKEEYVTSDAGTCKECYEEASETEEELKREIEDLKAKVNFLRFWSPTDHRHDLSGRSHGPGFTDVVLVAAEDGLFGGPSMPVPAHKAILANRSPVFKAMLENEMEESRSGTIKISDVSYDALRAFVNYFYSAEACVDEQMACELLVLAEKYQVKHLKAYCEKFLVSKLNWDNSIINYAFAHQHNAKLLLEASLSLIMDNMDKLRKRQEYAELVEKHPSLVVEILEACLAKQENTAAPKDASAKS